MYSACCGQPEHSHHMASVKLTLAESQLPSSCWRRCTHACCGQPERSHHMASERQVHWHAQGSCWRQCTRVCCGQPERSHDRARERQANTRKAAAKTRMMIQGAGGRPLFLEQSARGVFFCNSVAQRAARLCPPPISLAECAWQKQQRQLEYGF